MKKFKLLLMLPLLMAVTIGFNSCSDDDPTPLEGDETVIDVSASWDTWNYFSFAQGKVIGTGKADAENDALWKERTDWDIAFNRLYARTNSGTSGKGQGGVIEIEPTNDSKTQVFTNLAVAPATGYVVDAEVKDMMISMPPVYYTASGSATINSWLTMNGMNIIQAPKVLVIKTADGKYAKMYLKNYKNEEDKTGYVTFEYIYQANGSTNLVTE